MAYQMFVQDPFGLSDEKIGRYCPAVLAEEKHESRSKKYAEIRTIDLLHDLRANGFIVTQAMQSKSRIEGKQNFTKHLLRLRRVEDRGIDYRKPEVHEIVIINSLDGTSSYIFYSGIFRLVCQNGLVWGDFDTHFRVPHLGGQEISRRVIETTLEVAQESAGIMDRIEEMKQIHLSRTEQLLLAEEAMTLRLGLDTGEDEEGNPKEPKPTIFTPQDFLTPRFSDDAKKDDLWTVSNIIQNNAVEGGRYGRSGVRRTDNQGKTHTVRKIRSVDGNTKLNIALSRLTDRMRKLKLGLPLEEEIVEAGR